MVSLGARHLGTGSHGTGRGRQDAPALERNAPSAANCIAAIDKSLDLLLERYPNAFAEGRNVYDAVVLRSQVAISIGMHVADLPVDDLHEILADMRATAFEKDRPPAGHDPTILPSAKPTAMDARKILSRALKKPQNARDSLLSISRSSSFIAFICYIS